MKKKRTIFDRIRIKPEEEGEVKAGPRCEHPGCDKPGVHRAPKGRSAEGKYWHFCLDHVRAYNLSYNYFQGMPDAAVASYQKSALTGHRPTWSMGVKGLHDGDVPGAKGNFWAESDATARLSDPFNLFRERRAAEPHIVSRPVGNVERKAFLALNLEVTAAASEIKLRYKQMVKRFHPDANGGDKAYEEKLRDIIQAYTQLKSGGFC
jgi:hypothetical protein